MPDDSKLQPSAREFYRQYYLARPKEVFSAEAEIAFAKAYALAYSAPLREEIERLHKDSIARSDANTTLYQQVRAAEGRVKALRPFVRHTPHCAASPRGQFEATRRTAEWRDGDEKLCDCGLAAALGKKP